MPKVTEEYRVARRDEIADAALRAFRRKGFQATSMAEIIAESGLSAGAIYGHYPSKSAIVVDVASRVIGVRVRDIE
ncbi:TetR/AcrR family transcriptional regulator, partial [Cellulomonas sp. P5_C6]